MPKEITHWILAGRVCKDIPQPSLFYHPVNQFFNVFLIGAIAPDTPFTCILGRNAAQVQALSKPLHGIDRAALKSVIRFLNHFPENDPVALAFAAGVICHIMVDTSFHPMVGYYSGMEGVHTGARGRHRLFETAMDYYFLNRSTGKPPVSLSRIIQSLEVSGKKLLELMVLLFQGPGQGAEKKMRMALRSHTTLQYLFRARWAYHLFHFMHEKKLGIPFNVDSLFYPYKRHVDIGFFDDSIAFRDPNSGERHKSRMDTLASTAVRSTLKVFDLIQATLQSGHDLDRVLAHPDLPGICPGYSKKMFRYWLNADDLDTRIYGSITRIKKQKCF